MLKKYAVCGLTALVFAAGCGPKNVVSTPQVNIKVVETIPDISEPSWVNSSVEFWEEKGFYYYRGISEGYTNLETAKRSADASARTNIAEQIKSTVRAEFSRALESGTYDDTTGGYLKDIFFSAVDNITLSGIIVKESYLQHLLEANNLQERLYYRAYVLAAVSVKDYKQAVSAAFNETKQQVAANKSAKALVKETEERFWAQQEKNAQ